MKRYSFYPKFRRVNGHKKHKKRKNRESGGFGDPMGGDAAVQNRMKVNVPAI